MTWSLILKLLILPVVSPVVWGLVRWVKNLGWVKKLHIEKFIDDSAAWIIHYVESILGGGSGAEKMELACKELEIELKENGIKFDKERLKNRLEGVFNKIKDEVEHKDG